MDTWVRESLNDLVLETPGAVAYWAATVDGYSFDRFGVYKEHGYDMPSYRIIELDDLTNSVRVEADTLYAWCLSDKPRQMWSEIRDPYQVQALKDLHMLELADADWDTETVDIVIQSMMFGRLVYG
jgi:hypothetical protein